MKYLSALAILFLMASSIRAQNETPSNDFGAPPGTSWTQMEEPRKENSYARNLAASGNSLYTMGSVLAWGGLALNIAGNLMQNPVIGSIGSIGSLIGVPMLGVGAGKISRAAKKINPNYVDPGSGWPLYWTSWGLQLAGVGVLLVSVEDGVLEPSDLILPIGLIFGGAICGYVSWYKFSKQKDEANMALASLSLQPVLRYSKAGNHAAGAQLSLHW